MHVARFDATTIVLAAGAAALLVLGHLPAPSSAQMANPGGPGGGYMPQLKGPQQRTARDYINEHGPVFAPRNAPLITDVRITGKRTHSETKIRSFITTRPDRPYDPETIQSDVRRLMSSGMFHDVRTYDQYNAQGVSVTFEVFERPTIRRILYLGNKKIKDRVLAKETGLTENESLNLYTVEEARQKIEQFYQSRGFPRATVDIAEGNRPDDRNVVFVINEGNLQRVWKTTFEGNTFATSQRLKTKIETKRGYFLFIKGRFDRNKLDADVEKLTDYYRSFGFFRTRIDREYQVGPSGKWVSVRFVINEGPRYDVRNVSFIGSTKFSTNVLEDFLDLKEGNPFVRATLNRDQATIKDIYGSHGYIFADVQAEPRFLEEPGQLDLVYKVDEGEIVHVRNINVRIAGDYPHTKTTVVKTRTDIQPGDPFDIRKIRAWERRLKASQLFLTDPSRGIYPRVVVKPVEESTNR